MPKIGVPPGQSLGLSLSKHPEAVCRKKEMTKGTREQEGPWDLQKLGKEGLAAPRCYYRAHHHVFQVGTCGMVTDQAMSGLQKIVRAHAEHKSLGLGGHQLSYDP